MSKNNPVYVALDCGSGNVATVMENKGAVQIRVTPSFVSRVLGQAHESDSKTNWVTKGASGELETYTVMNKAIGAIDTRTPDYQLSAACRVLVVNALTSLKLGGRKVVIADTLPADQYYDDNNAINRQQIELKRKSLMTAVTNATSDIAAPDIVCVEIMPEAVTAYNAALYTENGQDNPYLVGAKDVAIVDIGRYTCDIAHLDCDNHTLFSRGTTPRGVHIMLEAVKLQMLAQAETIGIPVEKIRAMTLDDIDAIVRKGYYGSAIEALKDKRIYLDDIITAAAASFASEINYYLKTIVKSLGSIDALIIVGGGAYYICGLLREIPNFVADWHDNVVVPHQPETAVARGAYLALLARHDVEDEQSEIEA